MTQNEVIIAELEAVLAKLTAIADKFDHDMQRLLAVEGQKALCNNSDS